MKFVSLLAVAVLSLILSACDFTFGAQPGSVAFSLTWKVPPVGKVWLTARVEERSDPLVAGLILSSAGPTEYAYGDPLALTMPSVPNGNNRVAIVEARGGADSSLPTLYYGVSEAFSLAPGDEVKVAVPLVLQLPETEAGDEPPSMELLFGGEPLSTVSPWQAKSATIRTRSVGATSILVSNDASFTAARTVVDIPSGEGVTCSQDEKDGLNWDVCEVSGWDLTAELPVLQDGLLTVYVRFVDRYGYESKLYRESVVHDSTGPLAIVSSVSPAVAAAGDTVVLTVTFHEPLAVTPDAATLLVEPAGPRTPAFDGPVRVGASSSYVWSALVPAGEEEDADLYSFFVSAKDEVGNESDSQQLVDADGNPLQLQTDVVAPLLVDSELIQPESWLFGRNDESQAVEFDFVFEESNHGLPGDGSCPPDSCPKVRLASLPVGTVVRNPSLDTPELSRLGFTYSYPVELDDWEPIESSIPIQISWSDAAGNAVEESLSAELRFDFVPPTAVSCLTTPLFANGNETIVYRVTASELLAETPDLKITAKAPGAFSAPPEVSGGGRTFEWRQPAMELGVDTVGLKVFMTDVAGNEQLEAACPATVVVDPLPPTLWEGLPVLPESPLFGIGSPDNPGANLLEFEFVMVESNPPEMGLSPLDCGEVCPVVRLEEQVVGTVSRRPELDSPDENRLGFLYSYQVNSGDWGPMEQSLSVSIAWTDLAGNSANSVLPTPVRVDFIPPEALECKFLPPFANATATLLYSLTASEELAGPPELLKPPGMDSLFKEAEQSGGGFTWSWGEPGANVAATSLTLSALLMDEAGNPSQGPVCAQTIQLDTQPPQLSGATVQTLPLVVDATGDTVIAAGDGDEIQVSFVVGAGEILADDSPSVRLDVPGFALDFAQQSATPVVGGTQYVFTRTVYAALDLAAEGNWPVLVSLVDKAGNQLVVNKLGGQYVRVDLTPPEASCSLFPAPPAAGYAIGTKVVLQVSAFEELEPLSPPELVQSVEPEVAGGLFEYDPDSSYRYVATVPASGQDHAFSLSVRMRDLVGNETPPGSNGCLEGLVTATLDASIPLVKTASLKAGAPDFDQVAAGKLKAGYQLGLDLEIEGSQLKPQVNLGTRPMAAVSETPLSAQNGISTWRFTRTLDGSEAEGVPVVTLNGQDEAGNGYDFTTTLGAVEFDFTPAKGNCFFGPDHAAVGDLITLAVTVSEPLAQGLPELASTIFLEPQAADPLATDFTFFTVVQAGGAPTPEWSYQVALTDLAGNKTPVACTGSGKIDYWPPELTGEPYVSHTHVSDSQQFFVAFDVADLADLDGPPVVKVGGRQMSPEPQLWDSHFVFAYTPETDGAQPDIAGVFPITIALKDHAGNQTFDSPANVVFDFTKPSLVGEPIIEFNAPPDCPLNSVNALSKDGVILLTITVDDVVQAPPVVTLSGPAGSWELQNMDVANPYRTTFNYRLIEGQNVSLPTGLDAVLDLTATFKDLAGNAASVTVGTATIDMVPPPPPAVAVAGKLVYERVPWGFAASDGEAQFLLRGESGAVAPNSTVIVYDSSQPGAGIELARVQADAAGAFGSPAVNGVPLPVSDQDRPAVYVQVFDAGCNATDADANLVGYQRHLVKDVRWTVSMGSKVPGSVVENPHIFEVRPWFTQRFTQTDSIEPAYPAVLATAGDNDVRTDGAGDWIRRIATLTAPAARFFHSLAYDSKREVVVVFGGANTGNLLNDLWEFGQGEWQNIAPIDPEGDGNPIARQQAAMAYDSVRGKTVLFGGIWGNSAQLLDDTWEWDGVSWALVPQADPEGDGQPEPRRLHSMAFDQGRGVTVMMGGFQGSNSGPDQVFLNDTWEFNGRSWRLAGEFPGQTPKLTSRKMVYHKGRQTVIYDSSDYATHNLWEWDGENWTMLVEIDLLEDGSPTHYPGSMAYDPLLDRLLFFGGGHGAGKATNTIWAWKDHDWSPVQPHGYPEGPDVAEYAGWVYVPAVDRFLCFGGAAGSMDVPPGTLRGDTWLWDRQNWEEWTVQQPAALPPGLTNSAFQYDENEEVCWLAQGAAQTLQNSTYSWDGVRWRKHDDEFGNVPFAGYSRGDCFNRSAGQMYLLDRPETVGSGSSNMALLQRLDQDGWHTSIPTDPEGDGNPYAPIYCDIGCDEMDGQAILFGGSAQPWGTTIYYYDYTWRWTGTSWAKVVPLDLEGDGNPSARIVHSMTWDPTRNALMLLGGSDEFGKPAPSWKYNGPQWEWDGTSWLKVSAADPEGDGGPADTALEDHSTPYQTATDWDRERVMAVAHSGKQLMSLWEWNGESWVLRTAADPTGDGSPVSRSSPGLTYDTGRHRLVMYGGTIPPSSRIDELWEYDAGVSQRPGHVLRFATAEAGLADGDQLQGLSATWIAGATGDMNGMDGPGVDLRLWENGMWVNIGSDDAASADSPATLTWNEGDVDRIAWLPQGNAGWVGLAVTPKHVNGIDYATLVSDYVEVTVSYRKQ